MSVGPLDYRPDSDLIYYFDGKYFGAVRGIETVDPSQAQIPGFSLPYT
jgi:hypothetical protein